MQILEVEKGIFVNNPHKIAGKEKESGSDEPLFGYYPNAMNKEFNAAAVTSAFGIGRAGRHVWLCPNQIWVQ